MDIPDPCVLVAAITTREMYVNSEGRFALDGIVDRLTVWRTSADEEVGYCEVFLAVGLSSREGGTFGLDVSWFTPTGPGDVYQMPISFSGPTCFKSQSIRLAARESGPHVLELSIGDMGLAAIPIQLEFRIGPSKAKH